MKGKKFSKYYGSLLFCSTRFFVSLAPEMTRVCEEMITLAT
jgi:hypothetical protein